MVKSGVHDVPCFSVPRDYTAGRYTYSSLSPRIHVPAYLSFSRPMCSYNILLTTSAEIVFFCHLCMSYLPVYMYSVGSSSVGHGRLIRMLFHPKDASGCDVGVCYSGPDVTKCGYRRTRSGTQCCMRSFVLFLFRSSAQ